MAKKSKIARYNRQLKLIEQYADLRRELKAKGDYEALRKLPRDSNPNRLKNRDRIDGRPHAYMRKFGVSESTSVTLLTKDNFLASKKPAGNPQKNRKTKVFITQKAGMSPAFLVNNISIETIIHS